MDMLTDRRHRTPEIAKFVAELRAAFGETVDDAVSRGKAGEATFFAAENGRSVGTRSNDQYNKWTADDSVHHRHYCKGCDGSCVGTPTRCSQRP
jgi:hypothetical protein